MTEPFSTFNPDLSLRIDLRQTDMNQLADSLQELVEASGGQAGMLTTWNEADIEQVHSVACNIDADSERSLGEAVHKFLPDLAAGDLKAVNDMQCLVETEEVRRHLGGLNAVAIPVIAGGRPLGIFCLLHSGEVPGFVKDSPQIYNLVADHLEVLINNAALLQKLLRDRLWYESLLHNSQDGIVIINMDGQIVGINVALERLSGWSASEVVGQPYHKIFPLQLSERRDRSPQKSTSLMLSKKRPMLDWSIFQDPLEGVLTVKSGKYLDVEVSGVTVNDGRSAYCGWFLVLRDISQRKELERLGKVFLSAMSHELQTPIAVIKGFAGLLSDPEIELSPEVIREKAAVIYDEGDRLQKMVRQMLEATSIQAGGIKLTCEAVNLGTLLDKAQRRLEQMAEKQQVKLTVQYPENLALVWADPARLEQVLTNLIENALKHGAGGGVNVTAEENFATVVVRVRDYGQGISAAEQGCIFGMFQRGETAKSRVRGSGLGLFIAQAIVEAHGGHIGVESTEGNGACFYFSVPKESPMAAP